MDSFILDKLRDSIGYAHGKFFPEQSKNNIYTPADGKYSWVRGFRTGVLWKAYEYTGEEIFRNEAEFLGNILAKALDDPIERNNHDLGFLFSLSAVAEYKITKNPKAAETAIRAAEFLSERFHEKGQFIQAWGDMDNPDEYRLIIDCMMNIPLLFWAGKESGKERLKDVAYAHLETSAKVLFRDDYTSFHTFFFNPETGEPACGKTHQGYSDDSCWARGQAWGIYGLALGYAYTGEKRYADLFKKVAKAFFDRLPSDYVPYWDMVFTDGSGEPRDTSAAAIAVCGIREMARLCEIPYETDMSDKIMNSLKEKYVTKNIKESNGLLTDAMYSRRRNDNPECNIWGDYFYLEALVNEEKRTERFW